MDELHEAILCVASDLQSLDDEIQWLRQNEPREEDFLRRSSTLREHKTRKQAQMRELTEQLSELRRCLWSAHRLCEKMDARAHLDIEWVPGLPKGQQELLLRARSPILFYPTAHPRRPPLPDGGPHPTPAPPLNADDSP
eukprot:EG_transcript_35258